MSFKQDSPLRPVLAHKPSNFSTTTYGSATSAATSRSGGSRLLFGEIDTSSDRSSELYASVCGLVLSDSSTFLNFWLNDDCRDRLLSYLGKDDLASLRLVCHDFGVRAAPALFADLSITFKTSTFTRPARLAALDRLGFHVKTLSFSLPHTADTFLPPLVDPESGEELSFTYTPQVQTSTSRQPKYGDWGTTEILTRQHPPLFHAATNVGAFVRAFSAFINLTHLKISCPGHDASQRYRRSTVDFALISLRIAVERNCLNALDSLTLSPVHPGGIMYLSPMLGYGATPASPKRWSRIKHLTVHHNTLPFCTAAHGPDHFKLLQTYLRNFQANLTTFNFRWNGAKGQWPISRPIMSDIVTGEHPAHAHCPPAAGEHRPIKRRRASVSLYFPKLKHLEIENASASAAEICSVIAAHKRTIGELNLEDIELTSGTWDDALAPLTARRTARPQPSTEMADIPIMLSPRTGQPLPSPMERVEVAQAECGGRKSTRVSRWLSSKCYKPPTTLKKVLRGSIFTRK